MEEPAKDVPRKGALHWIEIIEVDKPAAQVPSWPELGPEYYKLQVFDGERWLDVEGLHNP